MEKAARSLKAKGILERACGRKLTNNIITPADKVEIMEYLLACPVSEMSGYNDPSMPSFIVECAVMLLNNQIREYMGVLSICRHMAREDTFTQK